MATYKQVTLKDPKTGDYLIPRVYGTLGYQVVDGEITPPFDPQLDAYTLQGHPASYFATATELNAVKTSVSEGKALVAAAVTGKGVSTAADATFQQMATNIGKIETSPSYSTIYNFSTSNSYVEYTWSLPSDVFTSELYGIMITFKYNMIVVNTGIPIDDESTIESKQTKMFIPFTKIPKFKSISGFDELSLDYITKIINYASSVDYPYAHTNLIIKFNSINTSSASIRIASNFSYSEPLSSGLSSIKLVKQQWR